MLLKGLLSEDDQSKDGPSWVAKMQDAESEDAKREDDRYQSRGYIAMGELNGICQLSYLLSITGVKTYC